MARKQKHDDLPPDNTTSTMVLVALRRIVRAIDLRSHYLESHHGLTGPQLALLRELENHDGCTVSTLSAVLHLSQATVTGILDRLGKRELIQRQRSDRDRRCVRIWLTGPGRKVLADAPPLLQEEFSDELDKLQDWERTLLLSSLQRIVAMMEAQHLDAAPMLTPGATIESDQPHRRGTSNPADKLIATPDPRKTPQ